MPFMDKLPSLDSLKALEWTTWISLYIPGLIVAVVNAFALAGCMNTGLNDLYIFGLQDQSKTKDSTYQTLVAHFGVCIESKTEGKVVCNSRKHLANNIGSFAQPWSGQTLQLVKPLQNKSTWQWLYLTAELIFVIAYILGIMNYKTNYDWEWMSAVAFALATVLAFVSVIGTLELQQTLIALNTTGQTWTTLGFGVLIIQWIFVVASAYLTWLMWSNFCRGAPEGAEAGEQQVDNE